MKRPILVGAALAVLTVYGIMVTPALAVESAMPAPLVFFDIAAPDLASQSTFYSGVFGWKIASDGTFAVPVSSPLQGNLRVESAEHMERVVYFGVEDVTATLNLVVKNGGSIDFPRFVVPGKVIVGMLKDPAGNRVGIIEMKDGKVVVPPTP